MTQGYTEPDKNRGYYAIIPSSVRYDKELSAGAKLLYGEITALSCAEGYCWATNEYFSNLYEVSSRTIARWIKLLEEKGHISTTVEAFRYSDGTVKNIRKIYMADVKENAPEKGADHGDKNVTDHHDKNVLHHGDKNVLHHHDKNVTQNNTRSNNTRSNNTRVNKRAHGIHRNVFLTDEELESLVNRFPDNWERKINELSEGLELKGYKYKSHYRAILTWYQRDLEKIARKWVTPEAAKKIIDNNKADMEKEPTLTEFYEELIKQKGGTLP